MNFKKNGYVRVRKYLGTYDALVEESKIRQDYARDSMNLMRFMHILIRVLCSKWRDTERRKVIALEYHH